MLQSLHIHNFALIEDLHINFAEGVTILTGETGAGKSILLDAIGMLGGKRASASFIRQGTDAFLVEGAFFFFHVPPELEKSLWIITLSVMTGNSSFPASSTAVDADRYSSMAPLRRLPSFAALHRSSSIYTDNMITGLFLTRLITFRSSTD